MALVSIKSFSVPIPIDHHTAVLPVTDLSLSKPWGPSGGLRRSMDRCNGPLPPPLPRSPRVGEEEGERAPQTRRCPPGEAEEAGRGCLLLNEDRERKIRWGKKKKAREKEWTDNVFALQIWSVTAECVDKIQNLFYYLFLVWLSRMSWHEKNMLWN